MNVKSKDVKQKGSALVFSVIVVLMVTLLITALLSLQKLASNKTIRMASQYQLELSAQSYIDMIVSGLNKDTQEKLEIPSSQGTSTISVSLSEAVFDELVSATIVRDAQDHVYIQVVCRNQVNQTVTMHGYLNRLTSNGKDIFEVTYYEMP